MCSMMRDLWSMNIFKQIALHAHMTYRQAVTRKHTQTMKLLFSGSTSLTGMARVSRNHLCGVTLSVSKGGVEAHSGAQKAPHCLMLPRWTTCLPR